MSSPDSKAFFHYTTAEGYYGITSGGTYGDKTGLLPIQRFVNLSQLRACNLPAAAGEGCSFGLLTPFDPAWCRKNSYDNEPLLETVIRDKLTNSTKDICLLRVMLEPTDQAYVVNYASHLNPAYTNRRAGDYKTLRRVKRSYWDSRIAWNEYGKCNVPYLIPEVVCFSTIPVERIQLVTTYHRDRLIHEIRRKGGWNQHPPRPKPHRDLFALLLKPEKK